MLNPRKKAKPLNNIKAYKKEYLHEKVKELNVSGSRLMLDTLLMDAL